MPAFRIAGTFGWERALDCTRREHPEACGIRITGLAHCGQPLWAGSGGVVTSMYYSEVFGYRLFVNVGVANGKGVTLVYNHAAGYSVGVGDRVARGQVIGSVGNTGWSTGCHLHFTVLANGAPVDPENWY